MKDFIQNKKNYIIQRYCIQSVHKKSVFRIEIYPGIVAEFGEPKSKLKSKRYKLTQLFFDKKRYTKEMVEMFWTNFHVKYIPYQREKNVRLIYRVIGSPQHLIHGGYIVICKNTSYVKESFKVQRGYNFWKEMFYKEGQISSDENTINVAIPLLIDRMNNSNIMLQDIPSSDHRVFEELVAEIFKGFGYSIELTKKTRDGGIDIVALKKTGELLEEKLLIECKHWKGKIDVGVIRNLIGVAISQEELPTGIIIATTSRFTQDAKDVTINKTVKVKLDRKDFDDIIEWIEKYDAIQLSTQEANAYFKCLFNV